MIPTTPLDQIDTEQLRSLATQLFQHVEVLDKEVLHQKTRNQELIDEIAQLKRHRLGITKALDYSLKRWAALSRYLNDGAVPIDNNWCENQIRPWALGRKNWLFAGSLRSGKRAAALMSLIQSARLNGHDVYAYLKDVHTRLPTQRASEIGGLLPHNLSAVEARAFQASDS